MHGSLTSGILLKFYHETERNFKKRAECGGRDTRRVAIAVDRIDVPEIASAGSCLGY